MVKSCGRPTEKILVTMDTKQDLLTLKLPGERYEDVVARLVREQKQRDYISYLSKVAKNGDFIRMDTDEEYVNIRDEVNEPVPRD